MNKSVLIIGEEFSELLEGKKLSDLTFHLDQDNKSQVTRIIKNYLDEHSIYGKNVISDYNIQLKFVPVNEDYHCYEAISFPSYSLYDLKFEEWNNDINEAKLKQALSKIFFLIPIIKIKKKNLYNDWRYWEIGKLTLWNPTEKDLELIGREWKIAKETVISGIKITKEPYGKSFRMRNNLLKQSETNFIHLRPHGKNSLDYDKKFYEHTNGNTKITKQSFWLNKNFINIILKLNK